MMFAAAAAVAGGGGGGALEGGKNKGMTVFSSGCIIIKKSLVPRPPGQTKRTWKTSHSE